MRVPALPALGLAAALAGCAGAPPSPPPAPAAVREVREVRRSAGCSAPRVAAGLSPRRVTVAGVERTYLLSVPAGDPGRPRALVVVFHGSGATGAGIQSFLGEQLEEAAAAEAVFAYPDGLGAAWPDTAGRDVAFFDALLAELAGDACLDLGRVFATGFSFGAYMSNVLGCARAGVVRAVAPLSGVGPFGACRGPVPVLLVHGRDDHTLELEEGAASRDAWRRASGCSDSAHPVAPAPCVAYDGCGPNPVIWCAFDGGHQVPDWAAQAVWSFFAQLR